ncbi:MAG: GNAT family N-acetyltransferase [Saccharofermentans sp.]|nr:GNAT family N-acetyltransferase [Saccharofermentans sp.]
MKYKSIAVKDKNGNDIELRSAEVQDAEALITYLKVTNAESPYLICEPEEITLSLEQEKEIIIRKEDSERELLLLAFENGKHIGNVSLMSVGTSVRYKHRCNIAIALYKEYCGRGIGRLMLETILDVARKTGYSQAELEVVTENTGAIHLYESLGFVKYGQLPNSMRYKDGSTADSFLMVKQL